MTKVVLLIFTTEILSKNKTLRPGFSWRKGYGSAGLDGFNFMINASLPISDKNRNLCFWRKKTIEIPDAYAFTRGRAIEDKDGKKRLLVYIRTDLLLE